MHDYQREFIEFAIAEEVLSFGEFTLKSGRKSPYFFNAGRFRGGRALSVLGRSYAEAIKRSSLGFDLLFGPAYKGIPLAAVTCVALWDHSGRDVGYCFNRKEAKDHGEGGSIVGAELEGRVLIIDDVITAGTAIRESVSLIEAQGATPAGVVVALDRQERGGEDGRSAIQAVETEFGIPVIPIVTLDGVLEYLESRAPENGLERHAGAIRAYRQRYGVQVD